MFSMFLIIFCALLNSLFNSKFLFNMRFLIFLEVLLSRSCKKKKFLWKFQDVQAFEIKLIIVHGNNSFLKIGRLNQ